MGMDIFRPDYKSIPSRVEQATPKRIADVEAGYPFKTFTALSTNLDVSQTLLADALNINSTTLQRRRGKRFTLVESNRIYQFERLLELAEETIGDKEDARRWLTSNNATLGDVPLSLARTAPGLEAVRRYLEQIRHGVYL